MQIGLRFELGKTGCAQRRQREAAYDLDNPIPLEGAKRCSLHDVASLELHR
jgi:hypothetical protein